MSCGRGNSHRTGRATADPALFAGMSPPAALYARGFVTAVRLTRRQFMRQSGRVFAGRPVERVQLADAAPWQPGSVRWIVRRPGTLLVVMRRHVPSDREWGLPAEFFPPRRQGRGGRWRDDRTVANATS